MAKRWNGKKFSHTKTPQPKISKQVRVAPKKDKPK